MISPTFLSNFFIMPTFSFYIIFIVIFTIKMLSSQSQASIPESKLMITQSAAQLLFKKYDNRFNFYFTKPINHIIYNRKRQDATLNAKDVAVLVEDLEYLKRYYTEINDQGKNEIKDRMARLLNFYASANMLQYEYPCMVINNMEDIFKKRRKRLGHNQSQEESQSNEEENCSQKEVIVVKNEGREQEELQMLNELDWSDIIHCNLPKEKEATIKQILDFEQQCSIYDTQLTRSQFFLNKLNNLTSQFTYEMNFDERQNQKQVNHLILDFDDLDKERIVKQYIKLTNKENIPINNKYQAMKASNIQSLTDKKPLSSSITIDSLKQSNFKEKRKQQAFNRQSMFIGSRQQRDKQITMMKKSSDLQFQAKQAFLFPQDMIINQNQCEQSPLHQSPTDLNFFPKRNDQKFQFFPTEAKKPQTQGVMKQSQILYNDYFIKQKHQGKHQNSNDFKSQLKKLKENPFELRQILKIQNEHEVAPKFKKNVQKQSKQIQHKNQLPFYLKRVKSHNELKPQVHDDKGFYKYKKKQQ